MVKGDAHLQKRFWQMREPQKKKNARPHAGSEEEEDRAGLLIWVAARTDALVFLTLSHLLKTLVGSSAERWLLTLNVIRLSFSLRKDAEGRSLAACGLSIFPP